MIVVSCITIFGYRYSRRYAQNHPITEKVIKTLHALVMSNGHSRVKPTPYREGQNVIKESGTDIIVYMPPESKDVPGLMRNL